MKLSPLKPLHPETSLNAVKLDQFRKMSNEELIESLDPAEPGSLKAKPDGTLRDGHHRVKILRERGVDVDALPREIVARN